MTVESEKILPVDEHIKLLIFGEAHEAPCDTRSIADSEHKLPPWYDEEKYKRGRSYIKRNIVGQTMAIFCGAITVFAIPTVLNILMKTQRSSNHYTAYRRYLSTFLHLKSWFVNDLKPGTEVWKSLAAVRSRHFKWSNISKLRNDGYISQRDLVLTLNAFACISLTRLQLLGMDHGRGDLEDYSHYWRTIGYMLGIEDRYNVFRPSLEETIEVCDAILEGVYKPLVLNPPEYFYHMSSTFLQSSWYLDPTISEGAMFYFNYRLLGIERFEYNKKQTQTNRRNEIKNKIDYRQGLGYSEYEGKNSNNLMTGDKFYKSLGLYNRIMLFLMIYLFENIFTTYIGRLFGTLRLLAVIIFAKYFPILFICRYGFKGAYVNMFVEDVKMETRVKTNKEMLKERNY